jgi:hypothetical protein
MWSTLDNKPNPRVMGFFMLWSVNLHYKLGMSGLLSLILPVLQPFGWIHKMMVTEKKKKEEEEEEHDDDKAIASKQILSMCLCLCLEESFCLYL